MDKPNQCKMFPECTCDGNPGDCRFGEPSKIGKCAHYYEEDRMCNSGPAEYAALGLRLQQYDNAKEDACDGED